MTKFDLAEGENCWRKTAVDRARLLLSGREYFKQLRSAMIRAEKSIVILAWDMSERVEMIRCEEDEDGFPSKPADFILSLLEKRPELEIFILLWDYSVVYIAEREWIPFTKWRRESHPRLHFEVDNQLPAGASHHQKLVIIDENLAFCGGFDLSVWRWDTKEHSAHDKNRKTPTGELYQPYHDIQVMLEGPVVGDLADLCADRWQRATDNQLPRIKHTTKNSHWPESDEPDFTNLPAGLALTYARFRDYPAAREIEQLYLDMIAAARDYLYIENQYLSSHHLVTALAERLKEDDGPEVVLVLTRDTGGWLEEGTMGLLRNRLLEILHESDEHDRFSVFYPYVKDGDDHGSQVYVHAKLMIMDSHFVRIGSANLSNRSMKVDSEVDLLLCAQDASQDVEAVLHRILAVHFNTDVEQVGAAIADTNSLKEAIEKLGRGRNHRLRPMDTVQMPELLRKLADTQILDPDEPVSPGFWLRETIDQIEKDGFINRWLPTFLKGGAVFVGLVALAFLLQALWGDVVTKESVVRQLETIRGSVAALPILFATFLVAGLVAIPINLLLVAGTIVLGPIVTFFCGITGALLSAAIAFAIGHHAGKPLVRKLAGNKIKKLWTLASNRGILSVAMLRVLPIAPFPVINLALGAFGMRFRTYMLGSLLGMFPGMLGVVVVTYQFESTIMNPGPKSFITLALVVLVVVGATIFLRNKLKK